MSILLYMWSVFCSVSRALVLLGFRHGYRCALERKSGLTAASHAEYATTPHKALSIEMSVSILHPELCSEIGICMILDPREDELLWCLIGGKY